jgi:hypothetical protein
MNEESSISAVIMLFFATIICYAIAYFTQGTIVFVFILLLAVILTIPCLIILYAWFGPCDQ